MQSHPPHPSSTNETASETSRLNIESSRSLRSPIMGGSSIPWRRNPLLCGKRIVRAAMPGFIQVNWRSVRNLRIPTDKGRMHRLGWVTQFTACLPRGETSCVGRRFLVRNTHADVQVFLPPWRGGLASRRNQPPRRNRGASPGPRGAPPEDARTGRTAAARAGSRRAGKTSGAGFRPASGGARAAPTSVTRCRARARACGSDKHSPGSSR
jgi:hypothetical protein